MSAATDPSAVTGGNTSSVGDGSRLEQPNDAVPMKSISQAQSDGKPASTVDGGESKTGANNTTDNGTGDSSDKAERTDETAAAASPKAKAKDAAVAPPIDRQDSMAIGPAQDEIKAVTAGANDGPVCNITLLLTTGSRHPYKLDGRYLGKRNVAVPEQTESGQPDPFSISIYTLKELILREWRSDWESKPASPSSIRLIHFGKLLDDKEPLKTYNFLADSPNVVHMSIRPQDLDEEEPKTGGKNATGGGGENQRERSGGCCVVL